MKTLPLLHSKLLRTQLHFSRGILLGRTSYLKNSAESGRLKDTPVQTKSGTSTRIASNESIELQIPQMRSARSNLVGNEVVIFSSSETRNTTKSSIGLVAKSADSELLSLQSAALQPKNTEKQTRRMAGRLKSAELLGILPKPANRSGRNLVSRFIQSSNFPAAKQWEVNWRSVGQLAMTIVMIVSLTIAAAVVLPELYFTVVGTNAVEDVANQATHRTNLSKEIEKKLPYMPPKNPDLAQGSWVSIPRIGVYSELIASKNPDEALNKGTWMVPEFGRPGDYSQPTIIAAHRYGWDWWWQSDYWKYNSFYLLTETEPGDRVEIVYDQRRWVYEIYDAEEGELITDYSADLILYTCKHLNSPIRHFRYARVVEV